MDELRPYLKYSAATHGLFLVAAFILARTGALKPDQVYHIDFIGPTAGIANRDPGVQASVAPAPAAPPETSKPSPLTDPDAFERRSRTPLPRPSFLPGAKPVPEMKPRPAAAPAAGAGAAKSGGEGAGASVSSDLPNFPYPWYITQVRTQLWTQWSSRMPSSQGEAVVMFSILRGGAMTDLRIEVSSGDEGFDYTALTAVQEAVPFPPLPAGFPDPFLKIHVKFNSQ